MITGRDMVESQNSTSTNKFQLNNFLERILEDSFRGVSRASDLAKLDIDHAASAIAPILREQVGLEPNHYRIEFLLESNGQSVKYGTGHVFPLNWIRAPLITLEYILTYAAAHEQCRISGESLPADALESMEKVRMLFDQQEIYHPDTDAYLHLANRYYEDRPWFYRLSTSFEVV